MFIRFILTSLMVVALGIPCMAQEPSAEGYKLQLSSKHGGDAELDIHVQTREDGSQFSLLHLYVKRPYHAPAETHTVVITVGSGKEMAFPLTEYPFEGKPHTEMVCELPSDREAEAIVQFIRESYVVRVALYSDDDGSRIWFVENPTMTKYQN
jgi:hypothetical protein